MAYQYKRRRPSLIRNFWVYRRLIGSAVLLGLMLWFIWANNDRVTVNFPFGLSSLNSSLGLVILLSALSGALLTVLVWTVVMALRKIRPSHDPSIPHTSDDFEDDRPPADYASKTTEGFPNTPWSN